MGSSIRQTGNCAPPPVDDATRRNESVVETAGQAVDVRRYVRIALANSWIGLLTMVVAFAGVFTLSSLRSKVYESSSLVRVYDPNTEQLLAGSNQKVDPGREVDIQVIYASSPDVIADFRAAFRNDEKKLRQVRSYDVSAAVNADAIKIAVRTSNRAFAEVAARAYTNAYVTRRRAADEKRYTDRAAALRQQAATLERQIADLDDRIAASGSNRVVTVNGRPVVLPESAEVQSLNEQRTAAGTQRIKLLTDAGQLDLAVSSGSGQVEIIRAPRTPNHPVSPKPLRDAAVASLVGLFAGLGITLFRYRLGDYITASYELATIVPAGSVLASIPENRHPSGKAGPELAHLAGLPRVSEAYRILRAEVLFALGEQGRSTLLVSSARGSEGKTSVATNFAASLASAGVRVALVDADLRNGRVHSVFGLSNNVGLSQVRKKGFDLPRAMQRYKVDGAPLDILTCGPAPANPAELLMSPSAMRALAELKSHYQIVVIDGPPVLPVADALHLARAADGVILVGRAHKSQFASFRQALERFEQMAAKIVATVLVGTEAARGDDKYYIYASHRDDSGSTVPTKKSGPNDIPMNEWRNPAPLPPQQPVEAKPAQAQPAQTQPAQAQPAQAQPVQAQPEPISSADPAPTGNVTDFDSGVAGAPADMELGRE